MQNVPSFSWSQDDLFRCPASGHVLQEHHSPNGFYQSLDSHDDPRGSVRWPAHYIQVCRREIQRNKRYITLLGHGTVREISVYEMGKV